MTTPNEERAGLIKRIEYILDPSASTRERIGRRAHLTNHDLRQCLAALRATQPSGDTQELASLVQEMLDNLKHCSLESGCCECGSSVKDHNLGSGHSPVDMGHSAAERWIKRAEAALRATHSPSEAEADEAYEIGKRDGYELAVQELDLATGGDGEFKGSTFPGETVDVPVMKARIIERFAALSFPSDSPSEAEVKANADVWLQQVVDHLRRQRGSQSGITYIRTSDVNKIIKGLDAYLSRPSDKTVELLREALEDVVDPLGKLRRDAKAEGSELSAMAYSIANDLAFVQSIARDALAKLDSHLGGAK